MTWFDENPNFLQDEENALVQAGYQYEINEAARSQGRLIMTVTYPIGLVNHELTCTFPAAYPFFAPKILGPTMPPGRHLDPYFNGLCLFEDEQSVWNPNSDNLAKILKEQIPLILKAHSSPENVSDIEGNVGYQVSGQIDYEEKSVIFVDDWNIPEGSSHGEMCINMRKESGAETAISGFINSIQINGETIEMKNSPLNLIYKSKLQCRWVKLDSPPKSISGEEVLMEAVETWPAIKNKNFQKKGIDIVGLVFPEESGYKKKIFNWIFVIRRKLSKANAKRNKVQYITRIIRSDRFTEDNMQRRVPRLKSIVNKNVLVVGAGALGSNIIWQLARAGISSFSIIDFDIVQAGNLPRWLVGFGAIGYLKVDVISSFIMQNYLGTKCRAINLRIGSDQSILTDNETIDAHSYLSDIISESDLVIDAAAETNVSTYLSYLCKVNAVSYVWATATQGGWGGIVGRVIPEVTEGDWMDFSYHYADENIKPPAAEEGSDIQPVGCFHPTFTGTGFDLDQVSLTASRLAVATLSYNHADGYPDFDWDVAVLKQWDEQTGKPMAPLWDVCKLVKYDGNRNEHFSNPLDK